MANVDRNALETVVQAAGEMFGRSVFDTNHLSPDVPLMQDTDDWVTSELTPEELDTLSDSLHAMVRNTLGPHSNKRIGYTLSGGVDSSLLLYLLKQVYPDCEVVAYHTDWKYEPKNELPYAKIAAEFAGVDLKVIDVSPSAQIPHLDEALRRVRTISYSAPPVYMVFKAMADDEMEIGVNALGLDELLAGYGVHNAYYERGRAQFLPYSNTFMNSRFGREALRRFGNDKAWFLAHAVPRSATKYVSDSTIDFSRIFDEDVKGEFLWTKMHNWSLDAMTNNYGDLIARGAKAAGLDVVFPYMDAQLMKLCLAYPPLAKKNKAPARHLMRLRYSFPEELASRGEKWDKIGWGGTGIPYFQDNEYMRYITTNLDEGRDWFTPVALKELSELQSTPNVRALHMAMFLKTIELL